MNRALLLLLALAAAGFLLWWAFSPAGGGPASVPAMDEGSMDEGNGAPAAPPEGAMGAGSPEGAPSGPIRVPASSAPGATGEAVPSTPSVAPARTISPSTPWNPDRGDLRVALVVPEGGAKPKTPKVDVEMLGTALPVPPLALEQEDGTWRYEGLPVGRYRVWVLAEGWRDAFAEGKVEKGKEARVEVNLTPGATAEWKVTNYAGDEPATFTLTLLDGRKQPISSTWALSGAPFRLPAGKSVPMPSEGKLIGLKMGTYTLRAQTEDGDSDEVTFQARLDRPTLLALKLKR